MADTLSKPVGKDGAPDRAGAYLCHYEDCRRRFVRKTSLTNHLKAHLNVKSRSIYRTKRARQRAAALAESASKSVTSTVERGEDIPATSQVSSRHVDDQAFLTESITFFPGKHVAVAMDVSPYADESQTNDNDFTSALSNDPHLEQDESMFNVDSSASLNESEHCLDTGSEEPVALPKCCYEFDDELYTRTLSPVLGMHATHTTGSFHIPYELELRAGWARQAEDLELDDVYSRISACSHPHSPDFAVGEPASLDPTHCTLPDEMKEVLTEAGVPSQADDGATEALLSSDPSDGILNEQFGLLNEFDNI